MSIKIGRYSYKTIFTLLFYYFNLFYIVFLKSGLFGIFDSEENTLKVYYIQKNSKNSAISSKVFNPNKFFIPYGVLYIFLDIGFSY